MFMLGYAFQKGGVPLSRPRSLERAIELNGEAVAMNKAAFTWGRRAALDHAARRGARRAAHRADRATARLSETRWTRPSRAASPS